MRRRVGRPGLMGTMARTAVVAGTATSVSNRVSRRQDERAMAQQPAEPAAPQQAVPMQAEPEAPSYDDKLEQIKKLGDLKADGLLTEQEFATEKARILGS